MSDQYSDSIATALDSARSVEILRRIHRHGRRAVAASVVGQWLITLRTVLADGWTSSETAARLNISTGRRHSVVWAVLNRGQRSLRHAISRSNTRIASRKLTGSTRASWLYRWFTAEPDPEVIVIDLRKTKTMGPFLRPLEAVFRVLPRASVAGRVPVFTRRLAMTIRSAPVRYFSITLAVVVAIGFLGILVVGQMTAGTAIMAVMVAIVAAIGLREDRSWEELRETKAAELLAAAFEPPEPPESSVTSEPIDPSSSDWANSEPSQQTGQSSSAPSAESAERDLDSDEQAGGNPRANDRASSDDPDTDEDVSGRRR